MSYPINLKISNKKLTSSISRGRVTSTATAVGHANQHFVGNFDDMARRSRLEGSNQTNTAILGFSRRIEKNFWLFVELFPRSQLQHFFGRIILHTGRAKDRRAAQSRGNGQRRTTRSDRSEAPPGASPHGLPRGKSSRRDHLEVAALFVAMKELFSNQKIVKLSWMGVRWEMYFPLFFCERDDGALFGFWSSVDAFSLGGSFLRSQGLRLPKIDRTFDWCEADEKKGYCRHLAFFENRIPCGENYNVLKLVKIMRKGNPKISNFLEPYPFSVFS